MAENLGLTFGAVYICGHGQQGESETLRTVVIRSGLVFGIG